MLICGKDPGTGDHGGVGAVGLCPVDAGLQLPHDGVAVHVQRLSAAAHPGDEQFAAALIAKPRQGLLTGKTVQRAVFCDAEILRQQPFQILCNVGPGGLPDGNDRNREHIYHRFFVTYCLYYTKTFLS